MNILLATQNKHKIEEITAILSSLSSINITIPTESLDIVEGDRSYIENALLKAKSWSRLYPDHYILADDSGLEVFALNNAPGVVSAEYAGKTATHQDHIDKLLLALTSVRERAALFVSYILLLSPQQEIFFSRGECYGSITTKQSGNKGFGYDPIFAPLQFDNNQTLADLTAEQKNSISHRYKALIGLKDYLQYIKVNK